MKVWARLIKDGKINRDIIYENNAPLRYESYEIMLHEVAYRLDIPSPIAIPLHYKHFAQFNIHRYKEDDFVDTFEYDSLEIETVREDKKKRT